MGMFGSARARDASLANPQPYQPAFAGSFVDPNPDRTYGDAVRELGLDPQFAFRNMAGGPPAPMRMNDDGTPPFGAMQPGPRFGAMQQMQPPPPVPMNGGTGPGSFGDNSPPLFDPRTIAQPGPKPVGDALAVPESMFAAHIKPHFFDNDGAGTKILKGIGEFGLAYSAGQGDPWALMQLRQRAQQQQDTREEAIWSRRHQLERDESLQDDQRKQNAPRYFSGKEDQLQFDPTSGKVATIYDAPTDAQEYARSLGYQPDTPEYRTALTDYTLKSYGPTAAGMRGELLNQRLQGSVGLEAIRQRNRMSLRGTPTFAQTHPSGNGHAGGGTGAPRTTGNVYAPILAKVAAGQPLTPGEQQVLSMRGAHGGGGHGGATHTATDPKTGRKVAWNGTAWVPAN